VLTAVQLAEFEATGICKIEGAFTNDEAARMRNVLWGELFRRYEIERDTPSTWSRHAPTGLTSSKKHRAFAPILGPALHRALDDLFGEGKWVRPKNHGQVLVTMPNAKEWRVPFHLWHADFQYDAPPEPLFAVKYWALFGDVEPGGGGTTQLAGSHRLAARYIAGLSHDELEYKRVRDGLMRSHPWLKALTTDDDDPDRNARFMDCEADIDGLPARVVECSGRVGDIYLTHPWVMHAIAPNVRAQPRFMRSMAISRAVA
jgi:hypothetical protein